MRYSRQRPTCVPSGGGFQALPFLTFDCLGSVNWTIGKPSVPTIGSGSVVSGQASLSGAVEQLAQLVGEFLLGIGLVEEVDVGIEPALMDDGVAGIAGGVEHRQVGVALAQPRGEIAPGKGAGQY